MKKLFVLLLFFGYSFAQDLVTPMGAKEIPCDPEVREEGFKCFVGKQQNFNEGSNRFLELMRTFKHAEVIPDSGLILAFVGKKQVVFQSIYTRPLVSKEFLIMIKE